LQQKYPQFPQKSSKVKKKLAAHLEVSHGAAVDEHIFSQFSSMVGNELFNKVVPNPGAAAH
jgi:hypothetical protein